MAKFTLFFAAFVAILVSASAAFVPMAGNQKKCEYLSRFLILTLSRLFFR